MLRRTLGRLRKNRKIVHIQKGYPHQNSSCLRWLHAAFSTSVCLVTTGPPADIQARSVRGLSSSTALLREMSLEDVSMASLCPSVRFYLCDKFQFWVIRCWMCLVMFDVIFYCLGWQVQPLVSHTLRLWRALRLWCIMNIVHRLSHNHLCTNVLHHYSVQHGFISHMTIYWEVCVIMFHAAWMTHFAYLIGSVTAYINHHLCSLSQQ